MLGLPRVGRVGLAVIALALALVFAFSSAAFATPADQTLGLTALQAKLDASGTVPAYMKTVVQGATITTIPVTVLAVTGAERPSTALILFEATGPLIAKYGGIVAGMSGSPIYVDDGGTDKVIGALSYGDTNTLGGMGEATPIENMLDIQTRYAPTIMDLAHPVITSTGVISRIMVTTDNTPLPAAASAGIAVAHPLATPAFIGGISPSSRIFKRAQAQFAKHNVDLIAMQSGRITAPSVGDQTFSTPLVPGASVAAMESRGDVWFGGIGTVTYTDSDTVLAYGHPESQRGDTGIFMHNAWIDGVWPSTYEPYKVGRIGALRGTFTQDRSAGILGVKDQFPAETMITSHATNAETGETTASTTYVPRLLLDTVPTGDFYDQIASYELPAFAAYEAGAFLYDQYSTPGSAEVTTTLVVRDTDHDTTYTVTMPNVISDNYDIPSAIVWDASDAISEFQNELNDDVYHYDIVSVDVTSRISKRQRSASIVGISLAQALKTGDNPVTVSYLAYGLEATQTLVATITIPPGTPLVGTLSASAYGSGLDQFPTTDDFSMSDSSSRMSIADIVKDLNTSLPGNYVTLSFTPSRTSSSSKITSVVATSPTPWAVDGEAMLFPIRFFMGLANRTIDYRGGDILYGDVFDAPDDPGVVSLYGKPAGSATESLMGTTTVDPEEDSFVFKFHGLTTNTLLRVHFNGDGIEYMPTDATVTVPVRCDLHFSTSASSVTTGKAVTLSTKIYPAANAGSKVTFEYNSGGGWRKIATKTLTGGSAAKASVSWKVPRGSNRVRVRFLGGTCNAPTTSSIKVVRGN